MISLRLSLNQLPPVLLTLNLVDCSACQTIFLSTTRGCQCRLEYPQNLQIARLSSLERCQVSLTIPLAIVASHICQRERLVCIIACFPGLILCDSNLCLNLMMWRIESLLVSIAYLVFGVWDKAYA